MTDRDKAGQRSGICRFFIRFFQIILYIPIQIVFIPFAVVGVIMALYKENRISRKLGVSYSAVQALQYRWIMHYFGTRPDPMSAAFVRKFPCESHFGMWATLGALVVARRLFGFDTVLSRLPEPGEETLISSVGHRLLLFDEIIETYVDEMEQIVLPGIGFDLMALGFTKGKAVTVFELDQANTLNVKVDTLRRAGIEHDWITYVQVDYSRESWVDRLIAAGFDKTRKTLFLWQSVSLYLEADVVKQTLKEMADLCADGSVVAQDFYSRAFASGETSRMVAKNRRLIGRMGEPWLFGIDMSGDPKTAVATFLKDCELELTAYTQFGDKLDIEPFYCIVEARKRNV